MPGERLLGQNGLKYSRSRLVAISCAETQPYRREVGARGMARALIRGPSPRYQAGCEVFRVSIVIRRISAAYKYCMVQSRFLPHDNELRVRRYSHRSQVGPFPQSFLAYPPAANADPSKIRIPAVRIRASHCFPAVKARIMAAYFPERPSPRSGEFLDAGYAYRAR